MATYDSFDPYGTDTVEFSDCNGFVDNFTTIFSESVFDNVKGEAIRECRKDLENRLRALGDLGYFGESAGSALHGLPRPFEWKYSFDYNSLSDDEGSVIENGDLKTLVTLKIIYKTAYASATDPVEGDFFFSTAKRIESDYNRLLNNAQFGYDANRDESIDLNEKSEKRLQPRLVRI